MKLLKESEECDFDPAGMASTESRVLQGVRFSIATLKLGLGILVTKSATTPSIWYLFSAMTAEVRVLVIITGIATGFVVWLFEVGMKALNHETRWMNDVMWDTLGRPFQMRDSRSSTAANITASCGPP